MMEYELNRQLNDEGATQPPDELAGWILAVKMSYQHPGVGSDVEGDLVPQPVAHLECWAAVQEVRNVMF